MKTTLMMILGASALTTMALMVPKDDVIPGGQDLQPPIKVTEGQPVDDLTLKKAFYYFTINSARRPPLIEGEGPNLDSIEEFATKYNIPSERMAKALEDIIRECLAWEKEFGGSTEDDGGLPWGYRCIPLLATYGGPGARALLKECLSSKHYLAHRLPVETYIRIADTDAIPFVRDILTDARFYHQNVPIYTFLHYYIKGRLSNNMQTADAEKWHAFLVDMLEIEDDYSAANFLDILLCNTLDGYTASIQRDRFVQRFLNLPEHWAYSRFKGMKSEIDRVPVAECTDLRKRFPPMEPIAKKRPPASDDAMDDVAIESLIMEGLGGCVIEGDRFVGHILSLMQGRKIPAERLEKVVKDTVRKCLPQGQAENKRPPSQMSYNVFVFVHALKVFPNPDTRALLKECIASKDETILWAATMSYSAIADAESLPLLRDAIANETIRKGGFGDLYRNLERVIVMLKEKGQTNDIEAINGFLMERTQIEQDPSAAWSLDGSLCVTLDDYATSVQRERLIQRTLKTLEEQIRAQDEAEIKTIYGDARSPKEWVRNHLNDSLAEIQKTPADKRTDLSKRFNLPE